MNLNSPPRLNAIKLRIFRLGLEQRIAPLVIDVGAILYGCPQSFMVARHDMALPPRLEKLIH